MTADGLSISRMQTEKFWRRLDDEYGLFSDAQAEQALDNIAGEPARLRQTGQLLAVERQGTMLYPGFQFDKGRARPAIADLIALRLQYGVSEAGVVFWLCARTTYLRDEDRPVDHLADDPDLVTQAAAASWGVVW